MTKHETHKDDHGHKHSHKSKMKKDVMFMWVIGVLLLVIAVMGFFLGKMSATPVIVQGGTQSANYEDLTLTVITDSRDSSGNAEQILGQIKELPSIQNAELVEKEFSEDGVSELLKENNITALPVFIFSTNNFDTSLDPQSVGQNGQLAPKISAYLQKLSVSGYTLPVGATFNPFTKRSDRGHLMLEEWVLEKIKDGSHIKGNKDATLIWLEYSDLECPYCAKLHNNNTSWELAAKYPEELNMAFNHFPLGFHKNAQPWAEGLECAAEQTSSDKFYSLIEASFKKYNSNNFSLEGFYDLAVEEWVNKDELKKCVKSWKYTEKVKKQMALGAREFGITWTPGNVLINNETWEYEVISWAYPVDSFVQIIDKLK